MMSNELLAALDSLNVDCPEIGGAVLATPQGLVLVATGCLQSDVSAASAANLTQQVDQNLSLICLTHSVELLIWASSSVWYLSRLADKSVLMLCAASTCRTGALRLAGKNVALQLAGLLASAELSAHEEKADPAL